MISPDTHLAVGKKPNRVRSAPTRRDGTVRLARLVAVAALTEGAGSVLIALVLDNLIAVVASFYKISEGTRFEDVLSSGHQKQFT